MKFLSDILAKAGLTVDGVVTLNNTATGQTPDANDNSTKLATTAWVRTFVQPYSLPIASASVLGGVKVGSGLSINSSTGVLSVTGGGAASIKSTQTFIATAGQTVFTISGGYTAGLIDVFLNGVYLSPNQTTATNGTTVTLSDAALVGDIIDVIVAAPIYQGATTSTDQLPEGVVNLYYTNARARAAISLTVTGTSGASTYDSGTGVLNIPTYTLAGLGGVPTGRTLTIDGVSYDLSANRTWNILPTGGTTGQLLAKVNGTNYLTEWIDNYTSQVKHIVKLGEVMSAGTPVYVPLAQDAGTNMTVLKASNTSEGTSSKTMGLIATGGVAGDFVYVFTEGLLAGLDTSTATKGDPVWLGPNGTLIFGLVNKPVAPAHLVFIGVVTRAQQNNGEIFVKVQNGFELEELHNLSVASPSDGDMIKYVASTGLWTKIAATTTNITEGTNLYYTQSRFDTAFAAKSTTNLAEGTNLYYTNTRARAAISVTGSGSYDSATGIITVTGGVTSVNTLTGAVTLTTTNIGEGTNLYYTTARVNSDFDTRLATKSTTNLAEGTNLYYTDARVGSYLSTNSYATQSYVATQIANLVASAPAALDTLNELAAALGNDASFSTTISTALGNRLRIDIGTQGLSATQQGYGRTNLGLGSLATLSSIDNGYITDVAYSKLTGVPTSFTPSAHTHVWADITDRPTNLSAFTNGPGYITGYTETSTLANVTARGASTTTRTTFTEVGATRAGSDTVAVGPWFRWTNVAEDRQMLVQLNASNGLTYWSYNGSAWATALVLTQAGAATFSSSITTTGASIGRVVMDYDGTDSWFRMQSGNRMRITTTGGTDFIIPNTGNMTYNGNTVLHAGNYSSYKGTQLISPNGATVVAADSAMPDSGHSFIHTLGLGPGSNDGHILGMTWASTTSVYGAQIWVDTDPNNKMAFRSRSSGGVWTGWNEVIHSSNYTSYSPSLTGSGASGTWGINVTGSAGSVAYGNITSTSTAGWMTTARNGSGSRFYLSHSDGHGMHINSYTTSGSVYLLELHNNTSQVFGAYADGTVRINNNIALHAGNYSSYALPLSGGTVSGNLTVVTPSGGTGSGLYVYSSSNHQYPQIYSNGSLEAMWNYKNNASEWYVGLRTSSQLVGTTGFHFYNNTSAQTVGGYDINGHAYAVGSFRAPIFYDSNNTGYYLDPDASGTSLRIAGSIFSDGSFATNGYGTGGNATVGRVYGPDGAAYSFSGGAITGAIKVRLPIRNNDTMWSMKIRIYDYNQNKTSEYLLGNYAYSQGAWNFSATYLGGSASVAHSVRFGNEGGYDCVWIGETSTVWQYPVVSVMDFMGGYSNGNVSNWYGNWDISIVTAFGTVGATVAPNINFNEVYSYSYRGNGNVGGTGSASWHPSGIYSAGTNWLYGVSYMDDVRGYVYYDRDDTTYFGDFASQSRFNRLNISTGQVQAANNAGGRLRVSSFTNGESEINGNCYNIVLAPYSTRTGAGYYYAGIAINGLSNYGGSTVYDVAPHIWLGAYYRDTPGSERSDFVVAVKSGTGTSGTGADLPQVRFRVDYNGVCTSYGDMRAPIFYDSNNTGYYLDPDGTSYLLYLQMPHRGNGTPNIRVNDGGEENWRGIQIGNGGNYGIGISNTSRSWSGRESMAFHVGADRSFRVHSDGWDSLFEVWGSSGYARLKGSLEVGSDIYLGIRGNWLSSYLNQGVRTDSAPTFSGATINGQVYINRHIDANATWGTCGCNTIFVGWGSGKVVLGNGNNGGHDYANGLGGNSVVSTNPFYCYQDITAYSDARVKENVEVVENAVEKIQAIRGVTFTRNDVEDKNKRHAGVIAQEVLAVLPEVVSEDLNGHYSVAYGNLNALLIEAIKEQQTQIEYQKSEIEELKDLVKQLINRQ